MRVMYIYVLTATLQYTLTTTCINECTLEWLTLNIYTTLSSHARG